MKTYKLLGERYKKLRQELDEDNKKCSQDTLAEKLKITKTQVCDLETGKREPSMTELKKYSSFFDTPMEYLLGISNSRTKEYSNLYNFSEKASILLERSKVFNLHIEEIVNELMSTEEGYFLLSLLYKYINSDPMEFILDEDKTATTIKFRNFNDTINSLEIEDLENLDLIRIQNAIIDFKHHRRELQMERFTS